MTGSGLYVALRGDASAQGDGTFLWRNDDGSLCARLTPDELDLLDQCSTLDTLAAHAARAAPALGRSVDVARAELEGLVARGLLIGLDDVLAQAPAQVAAAPRPRIVIRVLGRGEALPNLLAALAVTPQGSATHMIDVLLPDGIGAADMPRAAQLNARFHDAAARASRWQLLSAALDAQARARCATLLDIDGAGAWARASWNWALLFGRGTSLAVLDEHDDWPPRLAPRITPGLSLLGPARQTAWAAADIESLDLGPVLDGALGLVAPYLGQPAATLAAAYPGTAMRARGAPLDAVLWPRPHAHVRCIAFGQVLAAARFASPSMLAADAADPAAFQLAATLHGADLSPRAVAAHAVRTGCLVRTSALAPLFVDARIPLPPMPAAGGSAAWLAVLGALDADALTLELPVLRLRTRATEQPTTADDLFAGLIEAAVAGFVGPRVDPARLAARLADLAAADDASIAQVVAAHRHDVLARRLAQMDAATRAPTTSVTARATLANWRSAAERTLLQPLTAEDARRARSTLAEVAESMPAWSQLWSAADRLEWSAC
jgi:hypothetical protein